MAGRGCTITADETEEVSLPVALHSPLHVLKEQLEELSGITQPSQVLILCDLDDPDRNRDILLTGREYDSLFDIGIRNGSYLTLHRVGANRRPEEESSEANTTEEVSLHREDSFTVSSRITAAMADHSYNGILFDIEAKSPFEVDITSIHAGGMLGRVRIFAREGPLETDESGDRAGRWWAHQGSVTREGWELVADVFCRPAWDRPIEVVFDRPVRIMPGSRRAFYLHSGLPDDLGIQYQSYGEDDIVAEDEHVLVWPGLGHTGSEPFDEVHGWYRAYRGLAGSVGYCCRRKGWTIHEHRIFPEELREGVKTVLMARRRAEITFGDIRNPSQLANLIDSNANQSNNPLFPQDPLANDPSVAHLTPRPSGLPHRLISLPLHVLYHTLEFMDWNWFENVPRSANQGSDDMEEADSLAFREFNRRSHGRSAASRQPTRRRSHGSGVGARGGLGGGGRDISLASLLGRIYMEQLFGAGPDDEGDEYISSGRPAEAGRGVGGGALAALSAMLGGGLIRMGRRGGAVDALEDEEVEEEDDDDNDEDSYLYYQEHESESNGDDDDNDDDDEEEEEEEEETKDDHPSFTHEYDHHRFDATAVLSAARQYARSSLDFHEDNDEDNVQNQRHHFEHDVADDDEDEDGDIGYAALDSASRHRTSRRSPGI